MFTVTLTATVTEVENQGCDDPFDPHCDREKFPTFDEWSSANYTVTW